MTAKIAAPPPEITGKIQFAERPSRNPRGYFDALVTPTRQLLDRGFRLSQAADWWIQHNVIPAWQRKAFTDAMKMRLSRLRRKEPEKSARYEWRESYSFGSVHLLTGRELTALCGSKSSLWMDATSTAIRCARCLGIARKQGVAFDDGD